MINVIVTSHGQMTIGMADTISMLSGQHEGVYYIPFLEETGIDDLKSKFQNLLNNTSDNNQWIILCDILGGTPFKTACEFAYKNPNIAVFHGVNIPLLLSILMFKNNFDLNTLIDNITQDLGSMIGYVEI